MTIEYILVIAYMLSCIGIGLLASRKVLASRDEYWVAGRRIGTIYDYRFFRLSLSASARAGSHADRYRREFHRLYRRANESRRHHRRIFVGPRIQMGGNDQHLNFYPLRFHRRHVGDHVDGCDARRANAGRRHRHGVDRHVSRRLADGDYGNDRSTRARAWPGRAPAARELSRLFRDLGRRHSGDSAHRHARVHRERCARRTCLAQRRDDFVQPDDSRDRFHDRADGQNSLSRFERRRYDFFASAAKRISAVRARPRGGGGSCGGDVHHGCAVARMQLGDYARLVWKFYPQKVLAKIRKLSQRCRRVDYRFGRDVFRLFTAAVFSHRVPPLSAILIALPASLMAMIIGSRFGKPVELTMIEAIKMLHRD